MTTLGRKAIGLAQGLGPGHPFAAPNPLRDYLIADFYLSYDDPSDYDSLPAAELPLQLSWVYGLDSGPSGTLPGWVPTPVHAVDLLVRDATDTVVFDSTLASFTGYTFGPRLYIYEWQFNATFCRLVVFAGWGSDDVVTTFPQSFVLPDPVLNPETYHRRPKRVRSMQVMFDTIRQACNFAAGYNTSLEVVPDTTNPPRHATQIIFNFVPAAGAGIYNDCGEDDLVIRTINGVQGTANGDLSLSSSGCLNIYGLRPLYFSDYCPPCCTCQDYVYEAEAIVDVSSNYAAIGKLYQNSLITYKANIARWDTARSCAMQHPLQLIMQAQNCPYVDVAAQFCNQTATCQRNVQLRIRFSASPSIATNCYPVGVESAHAALPSSPAVPGSPLVKVVDGTTFITTTSGLTPYTLGGGWCDYRAFFDAVNPFESVYVRFRLKLPNKGLSGGQPYAITGLVDAVVNGQWLAVPGGDKAIGSGAVTLRCPQVFS